MQKLFKQRALRYRELARDVFDDRARDQLLRLAAECDEASATPSSEDQGQRKTTE
ncbi:MAG TPA: hypothetical protein VN656_11470 [Stellaceae bacterium]|jgi:hypothetical protein|nr:hypothetical protein [Stellaceae bacterium]